MILKVLRVVIGVFFLLAIVLWTAGAIYFDIGTRLGYGGIWLVLWGLFVVSTLVFVKSKKISILILTFSFVAVWAWWVSLKPSHDRDWDPDFSQLPQFVFSDEEQDDLVVHNVRTSSYGPGGKTDCRFETRHIKVSDLQAMDLLVLYWNGSQSMSHPMVIFDFGQDRQLCFSIEVRYKKNQQYNVLASMYRQYELIYVVSDERDAILRRTKGGQDNECYLYRYQVDDVLAEQILRKYISETNEIAKKPRWYNGVTANCTTSIYRQHESEVRLGLPHAI